MSTLVTLKISILTVCILFLTGITGVSAITQQEICITPKSDTLKYTIVGNVVGEDGLPIPFVNVVIEGTSYRTATDINGFFYIQANHNSFLNIYVVGMKEQRVAVRDNCIDVILKEIEMEGKAGPPTRPPVKRDYRSLTSEPITIKDIENADNPKYQFTKNAKKNVFVIFVSQLSAYEFNEEDREFQKKYHIMYSMTGSYSGDYLQKYNRLSYKHLKEVFGKAWHETIRKDAIGLDKYLK